MEEDFVACEISHRPFNPATNSSYDSDIAEGPNSDPLCLPANVRSSEQPRDIGVASAQDSRRTNVDAEANIEPHSNDDMLTATKFVSPHDLVPIHEQ